ncbi:MAG: DNA repair protein RadC [Thermoflavifilum sp.]|nr:DNA repair protein RadC [Thermoflavifilum sp.]
MDASHKPSASGIKSWAKDDRPREKLFLKGAAALSDAELLAILIQNGYKDKTAIDLAREVLQQANHDWNMLGRLTIADLMKIKGIGEAKAIAIAAALEIGRRRQTASLGAKPIIRSAQDAATILQPLLADERTEIFCILLLNQGHRVLSHEIISKGGISGTVVDVRIIIKRALETESSALILCHNHPSGNLQPSEADREITRKIFAAAQLFDIRVLDHLIVSAEGFFSMAEHGMV